MALYNGFSANYQNPYYQQMFPQQQPIQQPQQNNGIIWVQGEAGAKSYLVAPNTTVQLWDSEAQVIYLKSADSSGMPSMKVIDYTIRGAETANNGFNMNIDNFIHRDEFDALKSELERLQGELRKLKPHKKEGKDNG